MKITQEFDLTFNLTKEQVIAIGSIAFFCDDGMNVRFSDLCEAWVRFDIDYAGEGASYYIERDGSYLVFDKKSEQFCYRHDKKNSVTHYNWTKEFKEFIRTCPFLPKIEKKTSLDSPDSSI
jgi:hypothetical protein